MNDREYELISERGGGARGGTYFCVDLHQGTPGSYTSVHSRVQARVNCAFSGLMDVQQREKQKCKTEGNLHLKQEMDKAKPCARSPFPLFCFVILIDSGHRQALLSSTRLDGTV